MLTTEAKFLTCENISYTSKKTNKLVEFKEVTFVIDTHIVKFAFQNVSKDFDWSIFDGLQTAEVVELTFLLLGDKYDRDRPLLVLKNVVLI